VRTAEAPATSRGDRRQDNREGQKQGETREMKQTRKERNKDKTRDGTRKENKYNHDPKSLRKQSIKQTTLEKKDKIEIR
jgi:hypothetical protein